MAAPTNIKEAKRTPIPTEDFRRAVESTFSTVFEVSPTEKTTALIWAQWALETGRGKSCFNFNLCNIKEFNSSKPLHMLHGVWEIIDGKKVVFEPPNPQTWFRAYETLEEGMLDYLHTLKKRFFKSIDSLILGDAIGFALSLKQQNYFTASVSIYQANLSSLQEEFLKTSPKQEEPKTEEVKLEWYPSFDARELLTKLTEKDP